jgi:hypothetical protein
MSIEKIKQRIQMIESNDFTLNNEPINEVISGTQKDVEQIFKPNDNNLLNKLINKARRGLGLSDRDRGLLNALAGSDKNHRDIQSTVDRVLRGGDSSRVDIDGQTENLPKQHANTIHKIYGLMKTHNVLTNELNSSNFTPQFGYIRSRSPQSQIVDTLVLLKSKLISIQFNDDKLTNLVRMNIKNNRKFNQNDFQNFYNELNNNKSRYGVSGVSLTNSGQLITIDF